MQTEFPAYIRYLVRKLHWIGIPNLSMLICGLAVLAFLGIHGGGIPPSKFVFDPHLVMQGEWSRLFAFPIEAVRSPIWFVFFLLFTYIVVGGLEQSWGAVPLTLFVLMGYFSCLAGAFLTGTSASIWFYILQNVSLAFGTVFPDVEFYLFFVLPVKAKWLSLLAGVLLGFQFLMGSVTLKIFLLFALLPYLLFFAPLLYRKAKMAYLVKKNRSRFD